MTDPTNRFVDLRAEASVLGSVLLDNAVLPKLTASLEDEHFYREQHRVLWRAFTALKGPVDTVTVTALLKDRGELKAAGGGAYLVELTDKTPTSWNAEHYAQIVRERAALRALHGMLRAGQAVLEEDELDDPFVVVDKIERDLTSALRPLRTQQASFRGFKRCADINAKIVATRQAIEGAVSELATSWPEIDRMALMPMATLILIASRPGVGKTIFATSLANLWVDEGERVHYFVHEDTAERLYYRCLAQRSGIPFGRIAGLVQNSTNGPNAELDWDILRGWMEHYADPEGIGGRLTWDDTPRLTVDALRLRCRQLAREEGVTRFFFDHALEIQAPRWVKKRNEQVEYIAKGIRDAMAELNTAGVVLSQLSRSAEPPERKLGKPPRISSLKESGALEEAARLAIFLTRDEVYGLDQNVDYLHPVEVWVKKATNAKTGRTHLMCDPGRTLFRSPSGSEARMLGMAENAGTTYHETVKAHGMNYNRGGYTPAPTAVPF